MPSPLSNLLFIQSSQVSPPPPPPPAPHLMVIMMENMNYNSGTFSVIGDTTYWPYTNTLATSYGLATSMYGFAHPSLPNYIDIIAGSNLGVTVDELPGTANLPATTTLGNQLVTAGISCKAYAGLLPTDPTQNNLTTTPTYVAHYFPWVYFPNNVMPTGSAGTGNMDISLMIADLNSTNPPAFVWLSPGGPYNYAGLNTSTMDTYLSTIIPEIQATSWYTNGGQIIIMWDEANDNSDTSGWNGTAGGHVPCIVVSAALKANPTQQSAGCNTVGVLRTIENFYGVSYLLGAGNVANGDIHALLSPPPPPPPPLGEFIPDPFWGSGSPPPPTFPGGFLATPIPTNVPVWASLGRLPAGNSAILVANLKQQYSTQYQTPYLDPAYNRYIINAGTGDDPGVLIAWHLNDPTQQSTYSWDNAPIGTYTVRVPSITSNNPYYFRAETDNTDHSVVVWDYGGNQLISAWNIQLQAGTAFPRIPVDSFTAQILTTGPSSNFVGIGAGGVTSLSSSTSAAGATDGLGITHADFKYGAITHRLVGAVGNPTGIAVDPALSADGVGQLFIAQGGIPEGTIFFMPKSVPMPNFAAGGTPARDVALCEMIFTCLQDYGYLVGDSTSYGGVTMLVESNIPWVYYDSTQFVPNPMWQDDGGPYGHMFGNNMPWGSLVALEPGTLPLPLVTDNNGTANRTLKAAQAIPLAAGQTTITLATPCDLNDVLVVSGSTTGGVGTTIGAASGTVVQVYDVLQGGTQPPECFLYVIYGMFAGLTTLTLPGQKPMGDIVITRWSGNASNPILTHSTTGSGTSGVSSQATGNVNVTATGQLVIGVCHSPLGSFYNQFNYAEGTERSYAAAGLTNWHGTTWSGSGHYVNRHIMNSNQHMLVFQNCIVPTATGNVSGALVVSGGAQTMTSTALVLT